MRFPGGYLLGIDSQDTKIPAALPDVDRRLICPQMDFLLRQAVARYDNQLACPILNPGVLSIIVDDIDPHDIMLTILP